ncbi:MAG: hypothetical protein R3Y27_02570 [Clostridia bacterium]
MKKLNIEKYGLKIVSVVCILAIIAMAFALMSEPDVVIGDFVAPEFDIAAQEGTPSVSNTSYSEVYMDGMSFSTVVCALFGVEDDQAEVFFTNPDTNTAWLKLRIENADGNVIAETGIIQPGEYVQYINFTEEVASGDSIKLVVMSYEPDTYFSMGSVSLNTTLN